MTRPFSRHKLLLDENLAPRTTYPRLNARFDVKHIDHDLRRGGSPDPQVYDLAVEQGRIILTQNVKHFAPQAGRKADAGIIGVPPHWSPDRIDTKVTALLTHHGPHYFRGRRVALGAED